MRNRLFFWIGLFALLMVVLLGCSLSRGGSARITPTPTKTQRPLFTATMTPTASPAPTDTPVPTDTPLPSDTPVPPTETPFPTDTPVPLPTDAPPTETPIPTDTSIPAPANTSAPKPTNTPAPPTNTPKPQVDFRIIEIVAFEDGSLGETGLHNIYFTVIDAGGAPIDGIILKDVNNQPGEEVVTGNKGPGKTEFTMWAADYRFTAAGNVNGNTFSSETTHVLSVLYKHAVWDDLIRGGICTDAAACEAMGPIHYSYNVTFQRTW